jgi:hypothetical protein
MEQGHKSLTTSGKRQIMLKVREMYGAGRVTVSGGKKKYGAYDEDNETKTKQSKY